MGVGTPAVVNPQFTQNDLHAVAPPRDRHRERVGRGQAERLDAQERLRRAALGLDGHQPGAPAVVHQQEGRDVLGLQGDALVRAGAVGLEVVDDGFQVGGELLDVGVVDAVGGEERADLGDERAQGGGVERGVIQHGGEIAREEDFALRVSRPLAAAAARSSANWSTLVDEGLTRPVARAVRSVASVCFSSSVTVEPGAMARRSFRSRRTSAGRTVTGVGTTR